MNFAASSFDEGGQIARGIAISTVRPPSFMNISVAMRQRMWYIGNGAMKISLSSSMRPEIHASVCSMLARMFRW